MVPQHHCRHPQGPSPFGVSLFPFGQLYEDVSLELRSPTASCLAAFALRELWQYCSRIKATRKGISCTFFCNTFFWQTSPTHVKALEGSLIPALKPSSEITETIMSYNKLWSRIIEVEPKTGDLTHQVEKIQQQRIERMLPCKKKRKAPL